MSTNDPRLLESCIECLSWDLQSSDSTAAFLGSLIPVCLAVTLLSTPRLRKQWAFRLIVMALVLALVKCLLRLQPSARLYELYGRKEVAYDTVDEVFEEKLYVTLLLAGYVPILFVPFICDCALLCRLLAFHPSSITPTKKRIAILALPLAAHIPRLPLLIAYCCLFAMDLRSNPLQYGKVYKPLRVVEGGLQLLVNCYCSGFLLRKTYQYARADHAGQTAHSQQANRLRRRLRYMTESILFSFVPASLAQLACFIVSFVELFPPYEDTDPWLTVQDYLRLSVCFSSLYFGLLAVWWSNIRTRGDEGLLEKPTSSEDVSLLGWALGPLEPERSSEATKSLQEIRTPVSVKTTESMSEVEGTQEARPEAP